MTRVLGATLCAIALAAGQLGAEQSLTVDVDLVNIYFTVCNKHGRPVPNLARDSFAIYEDNTLQTVTHFSHETELPLTLALLIDTSGSVRYKLDFEQRAALEFLHSTLRPGRDEAAVVTFDSSIDVRQDYTNDEQLLANAVRRTRSGGGTRLYDALFFLVNGPLASREGRRAIIVLTDGDDNSSRRSQSEVLTAAQRHNVSIYAISVNSVGFGLFADSEPKDGVLETLASETGGKAFFPQSTKALFTYFSAISKELRSQYTIAYRSTNPQRDGTYRQVRIQVQDPRYMVRARAGYYAPTPVMAAAEGAYEGSLVVTK